MARSVTPRLRTIVVSTQRVLRRAAQSRRLDPLARAGGTAVAQLRRSRALTEALHGGWLGHAVHPMLTDFTNGPWMAASFLDLFGPKGSSAAARRLVGIGLMASAPTLLSGFLDWDETRGGERRVGLVHAATSSLATILYGCSFVARRRGEERAGVLLGVLGGTVALVDGYVGGELTLIGRVGTGRRLPGEAGG